MGAADERVELIDGDAFAGAFLVFAGRLGGDGDRDDLLGEHVERVARHDRRLDLAFVHAPGDDGALEQVAAELGEDAPAADLADAVPGASDALQPARDGLGRLDLQHEVDSAHVDSELERAGRDEARKLSGLEQLLDLGALLARERAVVGACDFNGGLGDARVGGPLGCGARPGGLRALRCWILVRGELVEPQRDALGGAAVVDEDDRRGVLAHQPQQLGVDGRPDRVAGRLAARNRIERIGSCNRPRFRHRLDGDLDAQVERLAGAGVDDRDLAGWADEELADLLQGVLRGGEADALDVARGLTRGGAPFLHLVVEALEREREVCSALGVRDGVDLVDDHRFDVAERLAGARGEHQVERLGGRDEDVRRVAKHRGALLLRRVAGADADPDVVCPDAADGRSKVALDVVGERLERAYVDDARANVGALVGGKAVEGPEEGGERLAGARGGGEQYILARDNWRPGEPLCCRRCRE